jgi:hypothetical protein
MLAGMSGAVGPDVSPRRSLYNSYGRSRSRRGAQRAGAGKVVIVPHLTTDGHGEQKPGARRATFFADGEVP